MLDPTESRMLRSVNQTFTKGGHASALLNGDFTFKLIECMAFQQAHFTLSLTKWRPAHKSQEQMSVEQGSWIREVPGTKLKTVGNYCEVFEKE